MKILFDPIVTGEPGRCSTNVQFITAAKTILAQCPGVFIYWPIPQWVTRQDWLAAYPQDERIKYFKYPQIGDRTREYLHLNGALREMLTFYGSCWDFDVLVTVRTGLIPTMKLLMTAPKAFKGWRKQVWLIEEMPLMGFKSTVANIHERVQDLFTLSGYLSADRVWIVSFHETHKILDAARDFFAPSSIVALRDKIRPFCPAQISDHSLLPESRWFKKGGDAPLVISHVGRMELANRIEEINEIMVKQFIVRGDNVKCLVCTQSRNEKVFNKSVVEVRHPDRDEFWRIAREEMHVMLKLSRDGGFNLSLIEPMMFGVPAIVIDAPWSRALLGSEFPFYVKSETQAYAYVRMFYDDYAGMYEQWASWFNQYFISLFKGWFENDLLYTLIVQAIAEFETKTKEEWKAKGAGQANNGTTKEISAFVKGRDEIVLTDVLAEMCDAGILSDVIRACIPPPREQIYLTYLTPLNDLRLRLTLFHGWEDASVKTGHLRRVK